MMRYLLVFLLTGILSQLQASVSLMQFWVAPHKVSTISMAPATSLHIKQHYEKDWVVWEEEIQGFQHEEGTTYLLLVQLAMVYDASSKQTSFQYSLVDILWKQGLEKNPLHQTCWNLTKITVSTPPQGNKLIKLEGMEITMEINDTEHRISGQSGCNRYFGSATFYEGKYTSSGPMGSTKMACDDIKTNMETSFLTALSNCNRYEHKGSKLYLYKDQEVLLVFSACKAKKGKMGTR